MRVKKYANTSGALDLLLPLEVYSMPVCNNSGVYCLIRG
jgi:hypothetical protein